MPDIKQLPALSGNANQKMEQIAGKVRELVPAVNAHDAKITDLTGAVAALTARVAKLETPAPPPPPPPGIAFVRVTLVDPTLEVGETTQATAAAIATDGTVIPGDVRWAVKDAAIATVDNTTGVVTATGNGLTRVIATINDVSGSTELDVSPLPEPIPEPEPEPEPQPIPPDLLTALIGGPPSVATVLGWNDPVFTTYEGNLPPRLDTQWTQYGANWEMTNYYDRAAIYFVWWARTGKAIYLERANAIALDYREKYLKPSDPVYGYNNSSFWSMLLGVALHYLATGDEKSRTAVGYAAEWLMNVSYTNDLNRTTTMAKPGTATESPAGAALPATLTVGVAENRIRARVFMAAILSHLLNAPKGGPAASQVNVLAGTWRERAGVILERILAAQSADGAYRDVTSGGAAKPFMDWLLNNALILYHDLIAKDARILPAIKRNLDYNWANTWLGSSFGYYEWAYTDPSNSDWAGGRYAAPDLSLMGVNAFGWVYRQTGNAVYRERGRAVFQGGVTGAYLDSPKHLNQNYESSFRALQGLR
jgi:hypothetical protein